MANPYASWGFWGLTIDPSVLTSLVTVAAQTGSQIATTAIQESAATKRARMQLAAQGGAGVVTAAPAVVYAPAASTPTWLPWALGGGLVLVALVAVLLRRGR